jgi:hypothetical protein
MKTALKYCDCELCLFKTFPIDNHLVNDKKKIVEAIIYHYIVRLSSLVKTRKDMNSYIIKFIVMINPSYLENSTETAELKEAINVMYKTLTDSGKCSRFSSNASLTKLTHKEVTYLKLVISSMGEEEIKKEVKEEKKEVISPIKIIIEDVSHVIDDAKTLVKDVKTLVEDIKEIVPVVEECIMVEKKDIPVSVPNGVTDASGSYYSYCVIS